MSVPQETGHEPNELHRFAQKFTAFAQEHTNALLAAICVVCVVIGGAIYFVRSSRAETARAWSQFAQARTAADFGDVATDYAQADVGIWARLTEGELSLREGVRLQFSDRSSSTTELKKAGEAFDAVLGSGTVSVIARERADLGKARLLETTSDGDLSSVIEAYEAFLKKFPQSIYKSAIEQRLTELKKPEAKDFYTWFAQQNPKPEDRRRPADGLPPGHPEIPLTLPPIPDELYPSDWSELKTDEASPADSKPAADKPDDTGAKKPDADQDAAQKPQ